MSGGVHDGEKHRGPHVFRAGHAALDVNDVPARVDAEDKEAEGLHTDVAHVARHALALDDAAGVGAAARRAHLAVRLGLAVRPRHALHVVPPHHALEALAHGRPDHVNEPWRAAVSEYIGRKGRRTYWPGKKCDASKGVPAGTTASGLTSNSRTCRLGSTLALAKMLRRDLVIWRRRGSRNE